MKHIRQYEARHVPKFNVGDPVRRKNDPTDQFYLIDGYDYRKNEYIKDTCRLRKYEDKDKLADREGFYSWYLEDELESIPEEELLIKKFNI